MSGKDANMELELDSLLEELASSDNQTKNVKKLDQNRLLIEDEAYLVVMDHKEGYEYQAFFNRYQDYFSKFDYIVGDWAFEQLRLRGFYQLGARKVPYDQRIDSLEDYLNEYCNFGCQYFVLAKETSLEKYPELLENLFKDVPKVGRSDGLQQPSNSRKSRRRRPNKSNYKKEEKNIKDKQLVKEPYDPKRANKKAHQAGKVSASVKEEFQIKKAPKKNTQPATKARKTLTQKQNFTIKQKEV